MRYVSTKIDRLIAEAEKWVGYLEKKSNSQLDSFTANAGSNNYTRFNRDYKAAMGSGSINMQWCGAFVSCVFMYAFGLETAKKLLCGNLHCYTPTGASYFKKKGRYIKRGQGKPKPGDVVFFYSKSKGRIGHVGIVRKVSGSTVYTIEGNTSGANRLITNGGGVCKKSYSLSSTYIDGYGRPPYDDVCEDEIKPYALGDRMLEKDMSGPDVKELQERLIQLGYDLGRWGADGEFGPKTQAAVKAFQKVNGLPVTGKGDPATRAALGLAPAVTDPAIVAPAEPAEPAPTTGVRVTGGEVNIRTGPSTDFDIVKTVKKGTVLTPVATDGWRPVLINGEVRWISAKYTEEVK